jgi:hypothetical protein
MDRREQAGAAWGSLARDAGRERWRVTVVAEGPWAGAGRASLWGLGQVLVAALDLHPLGLVDTRTIERLLRGTAAFRRGAGYAAVPHGRERYYDDNAWLALALVQAAGTPGAPGLPGEAERILRFLAGGTRDGGVAWVDRGPPSWNTCSTGPAAELAFRLALAAGPSGRGSGGFGPGAAEAAAFGEAAMGFLTGVLRRPDGLYADHLRADGTVEPTVWSYNQGTPVGAGALWARLRGDDGPLVAARETADAALAHFGAEDRLWAQPPAFNAIFFRNLLLLDGLAGYPPVQAVLDDYLDRVWSEARHPGTGWFTEGGIGRYERGGSLDQAGLVQLYALAAWPADRRPDIC